MKEKKGIVRKIRVFSKLFISTFNVSPITLFTFIIVFIFFLGLNESSPHSSKALNALSYQSLIPLQDPS